MKHKLKQILSRLGMLSFAQNVTASLRSIRFLRTNCSYWIRGAPDAMPIPPLRLVRLVSGISDLQWFFDSGRAGAECLIHILKKNQIVLSGSASLLDFGCGCARVLRHLLHFAPNINAYGSDLNPDLIHWCQENIAKASFVTNSIVPPLPFANEKFDLIYAFSVFTHLPVDYQRKWFQELRRILKANGHLILSTHGEPYLDQLTSVEKESFKSGNVVIREQGSAGSNYFASYHPDEALKNLVISEGFEIIDFIPAGAKGNPPQDLALLRTNG